MPRSESPTSCSGSSTSPRAQAWSCSPQCGVRYRRPMRVTLEIPDELLHQLLDDVPIPRMARVRYEMRTAPANRDVGAAVATEIRRPEIAGLIKRGERIAIGVGSRGVARLAELAAALVRELK